MESWGQWDRVGSTGQRALWGLEPKLAEQPPPLGRSPLRETRPPSWLRDGPWLTPRSSGGLGWPGGSVLGVQDAPQVSTS